MSKQAFTLKVKHITDAIDRKVFTKDVLADAMKDVWESANYTQKIVLLTYFADKWKDYHDFTSDGLLYSLARETQKGFNTGPKGHSPLTEPKLVN